MTTKQEFTNLKANAQRAVLFEKIDNVETHQKEQNGKVSKHEKELNIIKAVAFCILLWVGIAAGTGMPYLPGL